jgi:hypothetical protein
VTDTIAQREGHDKLLMTGRLFTFAGVLRIKEIGRKYVVPSTERTYENSCLLRLVPRGKEPPTALRKQPNSPLKGGDPNLKAAA